MISFPRADLMTLAGVSDVTFWPLQRQELSRTQSGVTQGKDLGSALWRGSFTTAPALLADAAGLEAALLSLNGVEWPFLAYDVRRPYPAAYPDGVFADSATIGGFGVDARGLWLADLAPGFVLSVGDYLAFDYGARPSRALHRILTPAVADGAGDTPEFWVFPALRPGAITGAAVTLRRASCEMIAEPGQTPPQLRDMVASSVTFSGIQIP